MSKRKIEEVEVEWEQPNKQPVPPLPEHSKKHTLDSDEEDSGDDERYNVMNENDIEGEEDGVSGMDGDVKFTPFNMKEELEIGHFDREGHFQWDKEKEIRDNWLDNIDWVKVKTDKKYIEKTNRGLADSSDSEDEPSKTFNEIDSYKKILELMQPGETVKKTLQRIGAKSAKISSVERWRRKKAGIIDEDAALVTKLTELANEILTQTGNMDIYEETYEMIKKKINRRGGGNTTKSKSGGADDDTLDMYADDFESKEKTILDSATKDDPEGDNDDDKEEDDTTDKKDVLNWEFKWKQEDTEIYGPYPTEQMQKWVEEGYFKGGVFVRKVGEDTKFYTSNRIDFDLYL